mmetsp:Transcript_33323/g.102912  ORF Transcript_33323/g.102912 Transcript_33323/m.102912 type:complete len:217 (+) Transcript_33323:61-711(+)
MSSELLAAGSCPAMRTASGKKRSTTLVSAPWKTAPTTARALCHPIHSRATTMIAKSRSVTSASSRPTTVRSWHVISGTSSTSTSPAAEPAVCSRAVAPAICSSETVKVMGTVRSKARAMSKFTLALPVQTHPARTSTQLASLTSSSQHVGCKSGIRLSIATVASAWTTHPRDRVWMSARSRSNEPCISRCRIPATTRRTGGRAAMRRIQCALSSIR